tara:strand:+ start:2612 stop:3010 length:399 start_codon:yes stop_codon:yes gene_type:complete
MNNNMKVFEGMTFEDLMKNIYDNSKNKKLQIDLLIQEIHGFIKTVDDAVMVAPIIKELMDVSVKNDEHLVKLASVLQRIITRSQVGESDGLALSESEKEELMLTLQDTVEDLQKESDRLNKAEEKNSSFMES